MPLPPPPADGLISTGKPTADAPAMRSASVRSARASPGTVATPRASTAARAEILSPIASIDSGVGPMKTMPAAAHARANAAFSARNPNPGWIACAPVRRAASITRSIDR